MPMKSKRSLAVRGGIMAGAGQGVSMLMSLVTAMLLSHLLGPSDFAIYAICLSLIVALSPLSQMGINAWLISRQQTPSDREFEIALGGMLLMSLIIVFSTILALPYLEKFSKVYGIFWAAVFTVCLIPLEVIALPASTRLERALNYKKLTSITLLSQLIGQTIGLIIAYLGYGVWGPLIGWLARYAYFCLACWLEIKHFPKIVWNFLELKKMLRFGFGQTIFLTLNSGRNLLFLGLIGRWYGVDAVGIVAFTMRVAEFITPLRFVAARMIVPVLAPISDKTHLMNTGQRKASELEILITIPLIICGGFFYIFIVLPLIGFSWKDTLMVLPWILISKLLIIPHSAAISVINMKGYFGPSIIITVFGLLLEALTLRILGDAYGLEGIGASTIIIWLVVLLAHWFAVKQFSFSWNLNAQLWAWAGVCICLSFLIGLIFMVGIFMILLITWRDIIKLMNEVYSEYFK
jgi:O-antigen/teichoic acid export membrane protein